jgi:hypothetical protein
MRHDFDNPAGDLGRDVNLSGLDPAIDADMPLGKALASCAFQTA